MTVIGNPQPHNSNDLTKSLPFGQAIVSFKMFCRLLGSFQVAPFSTPSLTISVADIYQRKLLGSLWADIFLGRKRNIMFHQVSTYMFCFITDFILLMLPASNTAYCLDQNISCSVRLINRSINRLFCLFILLCSTPTKYRHYSQDLRA